MPPNEPSLTHFAHFEAPALAPGPSENERVPARLLMPMLHHSTPLPSRRRRRFLKVFLPLRPSRVVSWKITCDAASKPKPRVTDAGRSLTTSILPFHLKRISLERESRGFDKPDVSRVNSHLTRIDLTLNKSSANVNLIINMPIADLNFHIA
jgi:hypothetical protein